MGVYNTYNGIQLKVSGFSFAMEEFAIGDTVDIPDGVYVGYEGVVVVLDNKLVKTFENIKNKWGQDVDKDKLLSQGNPLLDALIKTRITQISRGIAGLSAMEDDLGEWSGQDQCLGDLPSEIENILNDLYKFITQ